MGTIRAAPRPVVAAVNGPAAGGACSIVLAADFSVAAESAYLWFSFAALGLMPDAGASALVPSAAGRAQATRMLMLAERIRAEDAARWGLITEAVPDDDFVTYVARLAARLAGGPTAAYARIKTALNSTTDTVLDRVIELERAGQVALTRTADFREGATAFLHKRPARFTGR